MQYTRNDWYVACADSDFAGSGPFASRILGEELVIWRSGDKVVALEDRCPHRAAALSLGQCEGAKLRCMYHGLVLDDAGRVAKIPGQDIIPPGMHVRAYPVIVRYGFIWVWMGDAEKADPSLIPDLFPGLDLNDFSARFGVLDFDAEARLISENLLDFSHFTYVHGQSFQASEDWVDEPMTMKPLERGVRFHRWMVDQGGKTFMSDAPTDACDGFMGYVYLIPGVLVMWTGSFPTGSARAANFEWPDFSTAISQVAMNIQTITPVSERKSRYFFRLGLHHSVGGGADPKLVQQDYDITFGAFNEDKRMIEAQQHVIDMHPDRPVIPTVHDRGVLLYNRLKARLIAQERGDAKADADLSAA